MGSCCQKGWVDYTKLEPETMTVLYDDTVVATLEIQPGVAEGTTSEAPRMERMTQAKTASGEPIFVMGNVHLPEGAPDESAGLRVCAVQGCSCCECFKPCCCPILMPIGAPCQSCCTSSGTCFCGTCRCCFSCVPLRSCCLLFSSCCHSTVQCCKKGCCCCCSRRSEDADTPVPIVMPQNEKHKAHRVVHPLPRKQGSQEIFGFAAFTHFEDSNRSHRASLTLDPKTARRGEGMQENLAALPVLIDLAMGSTQGHRSKWTFKAREFGNFFEPREMVNFFKKGERLQTVMAHFQFHDAINPELGDTAPRQVTM